MSRAGRPPLCYWDGPIRALLTIIAVVLLISLTLATTDRRPPAPPPADLVVDPNTAPTAVLVALPRLGPTLAGRIVEERRRAPFVEVDDLDRRVRGIGPVTIDAIRPYLRIDAPSR